MSKAKLMPEERAARKAARERDAENRARAEAEARTLWKSVLRRRTVRGKSWAERMAAMHKARMDREAAGDALVDLARAAGFLARVLPAETEAARAFVEAAVAFHDAAHDWRMERLEVGRAMNALFEASMAREIMRKLNREKREAARVAEG